MTKNRCRTAAAALLMGIAGLAAGCGGTADGPAKYPVRGTVLVGGVPAKGMIVTMHNPSAEGNAARPVGVADDAGHFVLSTDADGDGAVPGDYAATFFWPTDNTPMATDRLKGRFNDVALSKHRARIEPRENELPPFELEEPRATRPAVPAPPRDF
ncbi:hypothetical protein TA3x_000011 [Tundrisphaera sp. TA3]|uniref:hypothetical protein n=1 Tax=Tundrisphaera sp. TA3 TaxID=3435775 RepID=UPI003EB935B7